MNLEKNITKIEDMKTFIIIAIFLGVFCILLNKGGNRYEDENQNERRSD